MGVSAIDKIVGSENQDCEVKLGYLHHQGRKGALRGDEQTLVPNCSLAGLVQVLLDSLSNYQSLGRGTNENRWPKQDLRLQLAMCRACPNSSGLSASRRDES